MAKLLFLGREIETSESLENLIRVRNYVRGFVDGYLDDFSERYEKYYDFEEVARKVRSLMTEYLYKATDSALEYLHSCNVYEIDRETFMNKYYNNFTYLIPFDNICRQVEQRYLDIIEQRDAEKENRQIRKESRGRWQGYGFGVEGAIDATIKAGAMNAVSGLGHSIVNAIGNSVSNARAKEEMQKEFDDPKLKRALMINLRKSLENVSKAIADALLEYSDIYCQKIVDLNIKNAQNICNSIFQGKIPKEAIAEQLLKAWDYDPFNEDIYVLMYKHYYDKNNANDLLIEHFGINVKEIKTRVMDCFFDKIYIDGRSEEELIRLRANAIKECESMHICEEEIPEQYPYIWTYFDKIDARLKVFDIEQRTVDGILHESRQEANAVRDDLQCFQNIILHRDIVSDVNYRKVVSQIEETKFASNYFQGTWKERLDREREKRNPEKAYNRISFMHNSIEELKDILGKRIFFQSVPGFEEKKTTIKGLLRFEDDEKIQYILDTTLTKNSKKGLVVTNKRFFVYDLGMLGEIETMYVTDFVDVDERNDNSFLIICGTKNNLTLDMDMAIVKYGTEDNLVKIFKETFEIIKALEDNRPNIKKEKKNIEIHVNPNEFEKLYTDCREAVQGIECASSILDNAIMLGDNKRFQSIIAYIDSCLNTSYLEENPFFLFGEYLNRENPSTLCLLTCKKVVFIKSVEKKVFSIMPLDGIDGLTVSGLLEPVMKVESSRYVVDDTWLVPDDFEAGKVIKKVFEKIVLFLRQHIEQQKRVMEQEERIAFEKQVKEVCDRFGDLEQLDIEKLKECRDIVNGEYEEKVALEFARRVDAILKEKEKKQAISEIQELMHGYETKSEKELQKILSELEQYPTELRQDAFYKVNARWESLIRQRRKEELLDKTKNIDDKSNEELNALLASMEEYRDLEEWQEATQLVKNIMDERTKKELEKLCVNLEERELSELRILCDKMKEYPRRLSDTFLERIMVVLCEKESAEVSFLCENLEQKTREELIALKNKLVGFLPENTYNANSDIDSRIDLLEKDALEGLIIGYQEKNPVELTQLWQEIHDCDCLEKNKEEYEKLIHNRIIQVEIENLETKIGDLSGLSFNQLLEAYNFVAEADVTDESKCIVIEKLTKRIHEVSDTIYVSLRKNLLDFIQSKRLDMKDFSFNSTYQEGGIPNKSYFEEAIMEYAQDIDLFEMPIFAHNASILGMGYDGFLITSRFVYYKRKGVKGKIELENVQNIFSRKKILFSEVYIQLQNLTEYTLPIKTAAGQIPVFAELLMQIVVAIRHSELYGKIMNVKPVYKEK